MTFLFRTAFAALFLALFLAPQIAGAANITRAVDETMGCRISVQGPIRQGDAETLRAVLEEIGYTNEYTPVGRRICLNSPGGFLLEGIAMANLIAEWRVGTAIPAGATCESACAVLFMAGRYGNPEAGGAFSPDRVLHPLGQLGFHAPSLQLGERAYTRDEVDKAYAIALDSMAEILRHRAEAGTSIPDSLFLDLLGTPPFQMTYVDTVGKAARWEVAIAPVAFPSGNARDALTNACWHVDSGLQDYGLDYGGGPLEFTFEEITADSLYALSTREFRYEGSARCELRLYGKTGFGDGEPTNYIGAAFYTGGATDQDISGSVFPYMLYPKETPINSLPVWRKGDTAHADGFFRAVRNPAAGGGAVTAFNSCRLSRTSAQVVNVNNFVNLRSAPGLRAPIVGQLQRAATVQVPDPGNLLPLRGNNDAAFCERMCNGLEQSPGDPNFVDSAKSCIAANMLWYQVVGQDGTTGYVSRHFLE
ncbi:SH3 domain-containing protein [Antarctobacter jejuensis]|uniref:SH3 domain-containing protein n=1 Tax=Antarctobacter jejuensis TaxID=1439938 RepID=UPI003FD51E86